MVMALTPVGYESMAHNLQEMRRFIRQQKEIILYYRVATEALFSWEDAMAFWSTHDWDGNLLPGEE